MSRSTIFGIAVVLIMFVAIVESTKSSLEEPTVDPQAGWTVRNSSMDGSVLEVEWWLEKNLADPDSFEAISWSEVKKVNATDHQYEVLVKYRYRNSFGGMEITEQIFHLDGEGQVVGVLNL